MKDCGMGVGCREAGACFAEANGEPERCPLHVDAAEKALTDRLAAERLRINALSDEATKRMLEQVVETLYAALEDPNAPPLGLHPSDLITNYIQRGNVIKDGDW